MKQMKRKTFLEKYVGVTENLTKTIPTINCGGCGYYALKLGKFLKENNIKFEYMMLFHKLDNRREVKNHISNNKIGEFNKSHWTHVVIRVGKKFVDATDIKDELTKVGMIIDESFLENLVNSKHIWNSMFDRKKNTKKIDKILKKHLEN